MTTIKQPKRDAELDDPLRVSWLESLGFSNSASVWSETRHVVDATQRRGRHERVSPEPDTMADWRPEEFGDRLTGTNIRWGLLVVVFGLLTGMAGLTYWLFQRPEAQRHATVTDVRGHAVALAESIPSLEELNQDLLVTDSTGVSELFDVESAARGLFEASADLTSPQTDLRRKSSDAAASALDGVRLVSEAHAYRAAVRPVLVTPELETDPAAIELDEAARLFGDWQLSFENVRTALPENALSDVTRQLDVLAGDLNSILTRYVDALRVDNAGAARAVLSDLDSRLSQIEDSLETSIEDIQASVSARIDETRQALDQLLDG